MKPTKEVSAYLSSISGGKSKSPKKMKACMENLKKAWKVTRSKNKEKENGHPQKSQPRSND